VAASVVLELQALLGFAQVAEPERDWSWIRPIIATMKKVAKSQPSRSSSRMAELAEVRILAGRVFDAALAAHRSAGGHRERVRALAQARTALALAVLVASPVRADALARLDLDQHFDPAMTIFRLRANEVKERASDARRVPPDLRRKILAFVEEIRPTVAPPGETRLLLGRLGGPVQNNTLSQDMARLTEKHLGTRINAQVMRNLVASFVVEQAPEEARLAGVMLNHRSEATTPTYIQAAGQVTAGRRLAAATAKAAAAVAPKECCSKPTSRRERVRGRQIDRARRRGS